ncbi:rrg1 [Candida oxycetoniae]|uniref:Rrg1 n=1 Tax=Candida oxycetoniae TaxID=497107 RepID=A0AAI9T1U6_9ASCO|nr:rrg1 [Candida oxycetoniae]KAI3406766.2 rrg1 [Candida oxycetoniae]
MNFDTQSTCVESPLNNEVADTEKGSQLNVASNNYCCGKKNPESNDDDDDDEEEEDLIQPLHMLDFPILRLQPPYEVLSTILKLLSPEETINFGVFANRDQHFIVDEDEWSVFKNHNVSALELKDAVSWLKLYSIRLNTSKKLARLPLLANSLRINFANEYNAYLTRIISNDLSWISTQAKREEIHAMTSLRLSENCGRMAQPDSIRKIQLPGLERLTSPSVKSIVLKEPSITNDNLGLKTWGSSLILSSRLLRSQRNRYLHGLVLELGSGTGLVGICCCILKFDTTLTDLPQIVPNLESNLKLNNLLGSSENWQGPKIRAEQLDWSNPHTSPIYGEKFDTIVLSDPIYSSHHPQWVVNVLDLFLRNDENSSSVSVLIEIPLRPKFEKERQVLWDLMSEKYEEIECEIEDGFDDFGEMKFCFKKYTRK